MSEDKETPANETAESITLVDFLQSTPPGQFREVSDLGVYKASSGARYFEINTPDLTLFCSSSACMGPRFFRFEGGNQIIHKHQKFTNTYFVYLCSNCAEKRKIFSLQIRAEEQGSRGACYKFGEEPAYGVPTPPRLLRLFGDDKDIFLKGRRCENQGLGIGAFVYYRRVVENHKNQILDEIIRVSKRLETPNATIELLENAKKEIQFSKALESVRDALPQALLINGRNPLTLLHSALSKGVHELTDARCLELAHDVRVVLAELAERLGQALKDEAELNSAVNRLSDIKK